MRSQTTLWLSCTCVILAILSTSSFTIADSFAGEKLQQTEPTSKLEKFSKSGSPEENTNTDQNPNPQLGTQNKTPYPGFVANELASTYVDGIFSYNIPIQIDSASTTLLPSLSLTYSSSSSLGLAGLGWNLTGTSTIHRCSAKIIPDGYVAPIRFDRSDRFCLNSTRLVAISGEYGADGTEYRLEVDDNRRIRSVGKIHNLGPAYFIVWERNGTMTTYGGTPDSRLTLSENEAIHEWSVSSIVDTNANALRFHYSNDTRGGKLCLEDIVSGPLRNGNTIDRHHVRLVYEASNDERAHYKFGIRAAGLKRLKEILILQDHKLQSSIKLSYLADTVIGLPLLSSIQTCAKDNTCLPPYKLEAMRPTMNGPVFQASKSSVGLATLGHSQWLSDINGDGLPDYVVKTTETSISWNLNTGSGWSPTQVQEGLHGLGPDRWLIDINGDGLPDYVVKTNDGAIHWNLNRGTGYDSRAAFGSEQSQGGMHDLGAVRWLIDLNGDGLPDYIKKNNDGLLHWNMNTGSGWGPAKSQAGLHGLSAVQWLVDINNDDLPDYVAKAVDGTIYWNINTGVGFDTGTAFGPPQSQGGIHGIATARWLIDINGDKLPDYVAKTADGNIYWNLNTGKGWGPNQMQSGVHGLSTAQWMIDLNNDGRPDYVVKTPDGNIHWNLNTGIGYESGKVWGASQSQSETQGPGEVRWLEDVNGDGIPDYVAKNNDGNIHWNLAIFSPKPLVAKIITPLGKTVEVFYGQTLSSISNLQGIKYPRQVITYPLTTVSAIHTRSSAQAPPFTVNFTYNTPTVDLLRRNWEGFRESTTIDDFRGIASSIVYHQEFPLTGKVARQTRTVSNGVEISRTELRWTSEHDRGVSTVKLVQSQTRSNDMNGAPIGSLSEQFDYDKYGNTIRSLEDFSDGYSRENLTSYLIDTDSWIINAPIAKSLTAYSPMKGKESIKAIYQYDKKGILLKSEREVDAFNSIVDEYEYGLNGSITKYISTDVIRNESRHTVFEYDRLGRVERTRNGLGQTMTVSYCETRDLPCRIIDANGLSTQLSYDVFGRIEKRITPDGSHSDFSYTISQPKGEYTITHARNGNLSELDAFDSANRLIWTERRLGDGNISKRMFSYDQSGRLVARSRSHRSGEPANLTMMERDSLDRLRKVQLPDGTSISYVYDGLQTTRIDPKGRKDIRGFNVRGALIKQGRHGRADIIYDYDAWNNLSRVQGPLEFDLSIYRNKLGRILAHVDQHSGVKRFVWNAFGELIEEISPDGKSIVLQRDAIGRITKRIVGGETTKWIYDSGPFAVGKITTVSSSKGLVESTKYDDHGRPHTRTREFEGTRFEMRTDYDKFGRVSSVTYPISGIILDLRYGQDEQVIRIDERGRDLLWEAKDFDASGVVLREQLGAGFNQELKLNSANGLPVKTSVYRADNSLLTSLEYTHDTVGNLVHRLDRAEHSESFYAYDDYDRLAEWIDTRGGAARYRIDLAGNVTEVSDSFIATYGESPLGPHAMSRLTWVTNSKHLKGNEQRIKYDQRGSVRDDTHRQIQYELNGLPSHIEVFLGDEHSVSQSYQYDFTNALLSTRVVRRKPCWIPLFNCSGEETHLYFGDIGEVHSTANGCSTISNIYARGQLKALIAINSTHDCKSIRQGKSSVTTSTTRWFPIAEPIGRISHYLSSDGLRSIKIDHTPYGVIEANSRVLSESESWVISRSFGRLYFDKDNGLYFSGARLYDPRLGRFLSSDRNDELLAGSQNLNRYSYALNNPLRYEDPTGFAAREYSVYSPSERAERDRFFNERREWADRGIDRIRADREIREGRYDVKERIDRLPKLEKPTLGDSYSRASERSYSVFARPPLTPHSESIDRNVVAMLKGSGYGLMSDFLAWAWQVSAGSWNYKTQSLYLYEAAGNFNYGATGKALGFSDSLLFRAAGLVQMCCGNYKPEYGTPWGESPFGDEPSDQSEIRAGIEYTRYRDLIRFLDGE